jgi:hypothetical protein
MRTLLQRCQSVAIKIEKLVLAQRHANQQRLVQERTREWKSRYDNLKAVTLRATYVSLNADGQRSVAEKRAQLRQNATQVLDRLKSQEDIARLTHDASWTRLLASIEGLADQLESSGQSAWRTYIDEHGTLEDPALVRSRAPSTPMNDAAITAYQTHYAIYARLVRLAMPRSADDLVQLKEAIAACRIEGAKIVFDVPPDVQRFFQAIQSGSATLASLTTGVLQWLAENGQLERYRIRSAVQ